MSLIQLENISKQYGKYQALEQLNVQLEGGMIGLLGPNGAGKTTLIRVLTGFLQPSQGRASLAGCDLAQPEQLAQLRQQLGYVPQHPAFYPTWTCSEFVDYIAQLKGMHAATERKAAVERSIQYVGLSDHANKATRQLSGGMQRRLGIAQAIVNDPKVLIVDEPTAGLDPEERLRFRHLLAGLGNQRLVIFSTHIVEDIVQTCRQVIMLKKTILYAGGLNELLEQARAAQVSWEITSPTPLYDQQLAIVSSSNDEQGYHYRIVGQPPAGSNAKPASSVGLEEAYLWMMQQASA